MFMQEACAAVSVEPSRAWPLLLDTDDLPKKKLQTLHRVESPDELCYIDFSVSTTGMLTGAKVCLSVCLSVLPSVTCNNNDNSHDYVYGAVIMTKVIARVYPVHLMNVD